MRGFLLGDDSLISSSQMDDKSIVVETNFKVYAYTSSNLYMAILNLFCKIEMVFPNFICGMITRDKVRNAFKSGITAQQIVTQC
jgi:transcription initiation factor TFIIH subunit 4